jgi:Ca-dependent carbohydrate-binding module xylan-binding
VAVSARAPRWRVTIDGTQRQRSAGASTTYSDYAADGTLPRRTHTITVAFANDYRSVSRNRNLYPDKMTLLDQAPSTQPAPSPTPVPAPTDDGARWFDSGFEAGLSPWGGVQACPSEGKSEVSVVATLALHAAYSMRSSVSRTCSFGSPRAEVLNAGSQYRYTEGQELYFADSVYFPATQEGHCITMQIHTLQRGEQATSPGLLSVVP